MMTNLPLTVWPKHRSETAAQQHILSCMNLPCVPLGQLVSMICVLLLLTASFSGSLTLLVALVPAAHSDRNIVNWWNGLSVLNSTSSSEHSGFAKQLHLPANADDYSQTEARKGSVKPMQAANFTSESVCERGMQEFDSGKSRTCRILSSNMNSKMLSHVQRFLVVSTDGDPSHFATVQAAVDAVPMGNNATFVIYIKPGTYYGTVVVPKGKDHITLVGEERQNTTLTYQRKASDEEGIGILDSATVIIEASHFVARNVIFENSSPKPDLLDFDSQTPAIRISGDKCEFYGCIFLGWQDTLYADQGRHYYKDCRVEGSVDFILGYARALFENCTIYSRSEGFITAQSRWCDFGCPGANSGFVFLRCKIVGTHRTFLGRPWRAYARVLFIDSWMGPHIAPQGWADWIDSNGPLFNHTNVYFAEINCQGPGANPYARVKWSHHIASPDVKSRLRYSTRFFKGPKWLQDKPPLGLHI